MKLTAPQWKYLKYVFWLGPMFGVMGLAAAAVAGQWSWAASGLIVAGIAVILLWLLMEGPSKPGFWGRRSTQVGTNALIATLAMLAIVGLINLLAVRYSHRVDLTENQIFTLAPQSQEVLRSLKQPVKAWIFLPTPNPADRELLENYRRQTPQFSYEYVDPDAKLGLAQRLGVKSLGEVHLETGTTHRLVLTLTGEQRLSERRLTNGLVQLTNTQPSKLYFVQGHGERSLDPGQGGFSQVLGRVKEEGYESSPLELAQVQSIPEDASVVVVAGAQKPLLARELTALQNYLKQKSGLMLLVDPETSPGVDKLLDEWGVQVSDRLIIDPAVQAGSPGAGITTIVTQYGDHPITKGLGNGISFYPLSRPLATKLVPGVESTTILFSSDRTQAQRIDKKTNELKADPSDPKPPYALGIALSRSAEGANTDASGTGTATDVQKGQARLVVIGNSSFATDGAFEQQLNSDVFLNAVSWLSQRDDQVLAIRPRESTNRRINLSIEQQMSVALVSMALLPVIGFGTAAILWWRRR